PATNDAAIVWLLVTLWNVYPATAPTDTPSTCTSAIEKQLLAEMVNAWSAPFGTGTAPEGEIVPPAPAVAVMVVLTTWTTAPAAERPVSVTDTEGCPTWTSARAEGVAGGGASRRATRTPNELLASTNSSAVHTVWSSSGSTVVCE